MPEPEEQLRNHVLSVLVAIRTLLIGGAWLALFGGLFMSYITIPAILLIVTLAFYGILDYYQFRKVYDKPGGTVALEAEVERESGANARPSGGLGDGRRTFR